MTTFGITGATGFIGRYLVGYCVSQGHSVYAFGRRARPSFPDQVRYVQWDITGKPPDRAVEDIDVVVHCAGSVSDWGPFEDMYDVNVVGTQNVLAAFRDAKQYIHISTASVYDPFSPKIMAREDEAPVDRYLNAYGTTKALGEAAVLASSNRNRVIIRPHAVYGPGDTTLLPRLLRAKRFGRFLVPGDGKNLISITHIGNLCDAVELIAGRELDGEIFNVTDSEPDTVDNIMLAFVETLGLDVPLLHLPTTVVSGLAAALERSYSLLRIATPPFLTSYAVHQLTTEYTLDIAKARDVLGYAPTRNYRQGFQEVKEWIDAS